jgi:hypothetical protein
MRQIRIGKRHTRSAGWQQEPLRPSPRDPGIVKAHRLTRSPRSRHTGRQHSRQMPA